MKWYRSASVYILFLLSGMTALVYQVAWLRSLSLVFGASHDAISIVLAAFMGGMALGAYYFGRRTRTIRNPLRMYALLELGIALVAALLPTLIRLADELYVSLAMRFDEMGWLVNLLRVLMAFCILLIPTTLMGGTLPALIEFCVSRRGQFARKLAGLYAVNTFGAVVGTVVAGFVLLPMFGLWHSQLIAVVVNVAVGLLALLLSTQGRRDETRAVADDSGAQADGVSEALAPGQALVLRTIFCGTAVCGLAAIGLEVMWARGLTIVLGATTYSITIMLAAFLMGIAIGGAVPALMPARIRQLSLTLRFVVVLLAAGVSALVATQMIPELPRYAVSWNLRLYERATKVELGTMLVLSFALMFVPCVAMGIAFPLAGEARARLANAVGKSAGDLVSLNTLGAIIGSILAGFVLIPYLGLQKSMLTMDALYIAYAALLVVTWLLSRRAHPYVGVGFGVVVAASCVIAANFFMVPWDTRKLGIFQNNRIAGYVDQYGRANVDRPIEERGLVYYREGLSANVSVTQSLETRSLLINGKIVATDIAADLHHEYLLGHLPVLLHPAPRSVVVVGLGAGVTLSGVAAHPEVERITVVEIEPAVLGGAEQFAHVNDDAMHDPRVHIEYQDGRNFLLTTPERYDVITADPIHPWAKGASYLFTVEYYRILRERLNDDGVMCQWLPLYELTPESLKSVVKSFNEVFPNTTVWQTSLDVLLIGCKSEFAVNTADFAKRMRSPVVNEHLHRIGLDYAPSLLAELTLAPPEVREFVGDAPLNTDDNLYLEFASLKSIGGGGMRTNAIMFNETHTEPCAILSESSRSMTGSLSCERLATYRHAKQATIRIVMELRRATFRRDESQVALSIDELNEIIDLAPNYSPAALALSDALRLRAELEIGRGDTASATANLRRAARLNARDVAALRLLGRICMREGKFDAALARFDAALERDPRCVEAMLECADACTELGDRTRAREMYQRAAGVAPFYAPVLVAYGKSLIDAGDQAEGLAYLERAVHQAPRNASAQRELGRALIAAGREAEGRAHVAVAMSLQADGG
ncbi:MAG: fused MFS/spermidine synthase [Phycisphaerales bacterium]|nr:fused MFS/spermidine synthase [Phycisphaerales bacterium]